MKLYFSNFQKYMYFFSKECVIEVADNSKLKGEFRLSLKNIFILFFYFLNICVQDGP